MALQIRQMDMKDIMGVVAIVRQEMNCTDNSSDIYDRVMRMYRDENYTIFVAEQEGTVIGFAAVMRSLAFERKGDFVRVLALSVRKEYDGSGVETQLMGRVEDDALGRGAYAIVDGWFGRRNFRLPDVVFFTDDYVAQGGLMALLRHGVRIPEDVRIVTWANRDLGPVFVKPFTRMEFDCVAVGETMARCVLEHLRTGTFPSGVTVGPTYMRGETF